MASSQQHASERASPDLTGTTIGRYLIQALLGSGGQGEVYRAQDQALHRIVALKRLSPALRTDERYRQRFLREAQRASGLNDPHIAGIYDVLENNGDLLLVMEYVEGASLRQRLREPLTLADFLKIATQCCEALIAAHGSGVVHRDIKPENIMLTQHGRIKVLDFGVAKRLPTEDEPEGSNTTETKAGQLSGTPAYMAPEVLLERPSDGRADIFSLGVVFYEALAGRHPFMAPGLVATVDRILHEQPKPIRERNPKVPPGLERIVLKMLEKEPAKRYSSARDLLNELNTIRTLSSGEVLPSLRPETWKRVAVGVAAIGAVMLAWVAAQYWPTKQPIFTARDWVLIADPENATGQPIFNDSLREALTITLQQSRYVNVLPRPRIFEALERMKHGGVARVDENLGREICQRENVRVLLAGSVRSSGQALQITVRAIRPDSGDLLFAETEQLKNKEEFFERVDALAKRVRNDLGESEARVEASTKPLEKVTTRSLEALQLYSRASDAMARGEMEQAPTLLQSAIQLDPGFAAAHLRLNTYYSWIGGKNERAIQELERAFELRSGVSKREQLWIEGTYFAAREEYEKAVEALTTMVELYPDDAEAHQELAIGYDSVGQLAKAIPQMREAVRLNPYSVPSYGKLTRYLARNNDDDEAIRVYQEAGARGVESPYLHWGLGLAYLGQDRLPQAKDEFRRLTASSSYRDLGELFLSRTSLYEGRFFTAMPALAVALQVEKGAQEDQGLTLLRRYLLARAHLLLSNNRIAREQADLIVATGERNLQTIDLLSAGRIYAEAGQTQSARRILKLLDNARKVHPSAWNNSSFHYLQGEIANSERAPKRAEAAFRIADSEYPRFEVHWGLARAYAAQHNWKAAADQWQKVLEARGEILQNGFPPDLVIADLQLARTYRRLNNPVQARIHYERFVNLWQHADNIPVRVRALQEWQELSHKPQPTAPRK